MSTPIDKELLVKYIHNQCTPAELEQVKQFLLQQEWQQALDELLEEDFRTFDAGVPGDALIEKWNLKFQERLGYDTIHMRPSSPRKQLWLRYAASIVVLITAAVYGWYWYSSTALSRIVMIEHTVPHGERLLVTLPDNSVVTLEAGSYLKYPKQFVDSIREIQLKGEAFFEVVRNTERPFIVRSGTVHTRVLGTSFKVDAFESRLVIVSVATGRVQVDRQDPVTKQKQRLAVLKPGQEVKWDSVAATSTVTNVRVEDLQAWRKGKLVFINSSLQDIAEKLERRYNVNIGFDEEAMKEYHLSLTINETAPLLHALDIICATAHLEYQRKDHEIMISNNHKK